MQQVLAQNAPRELNLSESSANVDQWVSDEIKAFRGKLEEFKFEKSTPLSIKISDILRQSNFT